MEPGQDNKEENGNDLSLKIIKVESVTTDMGSFEDKLRLCDFMAFTETTERQTLHYDPSQVPRDLETLDLKNFFKLSVCMRKLQIIVQELFNHYPDYQLGEKESELLGIPISGQGKIDRSNNKIRLALNTKCFGPDQMNFGISNIEQLLEGIAAPWSVNEKLTILAYTVQTFCKLMTDKMQEHGKTQVQNDQMASMVMTDLRPHPRKMGIYVSNSCSNLHEWEGMKSLRYPYIKLETLPPNSKDEEKESNEFLVEISLSDELPDINRHNTHDVNFHKSAALSTVRFPCINNKNGCPIKTFPNLLFEHISNCMYPTVNEGTVTSKITLQGSKRRFTAMCRSYEKPLGIVFSYKLESGQLQVKAQCFKKPQHGYVLVIYDEYGRPKHRVQSITSRTPHLLPLTNPIHGRNLTYRILMAI